MKLRFIRPKQLIDGARKYFIIIDGHASGEIGPKEEKIIDVSDKPHEIRLKIEWCGSNTIKVADSNRPEVTFSCYNTFALKLFALLLLIFCGIALYAITNLYFILNLTILIYYLCLLIVLLYITLLRKRYLTLEEKQNYNSVEG